MATQDNTIKEETFPDFKVNDIVYHFVYGKGLIIKIDYNLINFPILVVFENEPESKSFTNNGKHFHSDLPTLSFTPYDLVNGGFSQERPKPNYNDYIGKWGVFKDKKGDYNNVRIIGRLEEYQENRSHPFKRLEYVWYELFEPLTDEQIKILNLE